MKTSKKLLIVIAIALLSIFISALFVLKHDIKTLIENQSLMQFEEVPANSFNKLVVKTNCEVTIIQGRKYKVEWGVENGDMAKPDFEYINDSLIIANVGDSGNPGKLYTRITVPSLQFIMAHGNSNVEMRNYWTDSLTVILADSSQFSGSNNDITHINYRTTDK